MVVYPLTISVVFQDVTKGFVACRSDSTRRAPAGPLCLPVFTIPAAFPAIRLASEKGWFEGYSSSRVLPRPGSVGALKPVASAICLVHPGSDELVETDAAFDGVVAGEVLEHIEAEGRAPSVGARVLRPGGALVVSVPAHPAWFGASDRWAGHVRRYTVPRLRARSKIQAS